MALLILSNESVGVSSGSYEIYGTTKTKETITVASGAIAVFDPSFGAGGDVIAVTGNASSYTAKADGSNLILTDSSGSKLSIPTGDQRSTSLKFSDAERPLIFVGTVLKLGDQTVTTTAATVAPGSGGGGSVVGQTFTLTTGVDTVFGSAGDDRIVGTIDSGLVAPSTLTVLDLIDGGAGRDTLDISAVTKINVPAALRLSNIENVTIAAAEEITATDVAASFGDIANLSVTRAQSVSLEGVGDSTAVNVSNVVGTGTPGSGNVIIAGGASQTVSLAAQAGIVDLSGSAGAVNVTAAKNGVGENITVTDGSTVTVNTTSTGSNGNISVADATGAVSITSKLSGSVVTDDPVGPTVIGAITQDTIDVTGGSTVTVNSSITIAAKDLTADAAHTFGDVTVTGDGTTTSVTVNQTYAETEFTKAKAAAVADKHTVTFVKLAAEDTTTVDGLTFTATKTLTAGEVASAFSNLTKSDTQSSGGKVANGVFTGQLSADFTSGAASGADVVFSGVAGTGVTLSLATVQALGSDVTKEAVPFVAGKAATAADTSVNTVSYGNVSVDDVGVAGASSITTVSLNGYGSADLGTTFALDKLASISLANSNGVATVDTAATVLGLTVNKLGTAANTVLSLAAVPGTIDLSASSDLKTLNVTATGAASIFGLNASSVTSLTVNGDKALDVSTGSTLSNLETVTVSGTAGLTIKGAASGTLMSVNTAATTGAVTATIDGAKATYTGGEGVDTVTLLNATVPAKNVALGGGNDTLDASAAAVDVTKAFKFDGGTGTNTLKLSADQAETLSGDTVFAGKISNFSKLSLGALAADKTVDLANLDDISFVISGGVGSNTLTLINLVDSGTVSLTKASVGGIVVEMADVTGEADSLNILTADLAIINVGAVTADGVETFNITTTDPFVDLTSVAEPGVPDGKDDVNSAVTLAVSGDSVTTVKVAGAGDITLLASDSTLVTVDASALTGKLTFEATVADLTVKGGADVDTLTARADDVSLYGNAGKDVLTVDSGARVNLYGGADADTFVFSAGASSALDTYTVINGVTSGDVIKLTGADTFKQAKLALSVGADETLLNYANQAIKVLDQGEMGWFTRAGNTYIVLDNAISSSVETFTAGTDMVVMITGVVDLSTASYNSDSNTLEIA
jgi:S-layer protein